MDYDFFISHASEDKEKVARPLAELLKNRGWKVWIDEDSMRQGSIRQQLDEGLKSSCFSVVILSDFYFTKFWTNREADVLFEWSNKLLVRHKISVPQCKEYSPLFGGSLLNLSTDDGLEKIVKEIENQYNEFVNINTDQVKKMPKPTDESNNQEYVYAIGIDVGTAYIDSGIVRYSNSEFPAPEIYEQIEKSPWNGEEEAHLLVQKICDAIVHISTKYQSVKPMNIKYIGVGLPGQVNPDGGILFNAPALNLKGLEIVEAIKDELPNRSSNWESRALESRIFIDNDATCAALAENLKGAGKDNIKNFVSVAIGKGVGAGLVIDGTLYRGHNNNAGELGHMVIDISRDRRKCTCKSEGCFESYCSERGVLQTTEEHIKEYNDATASPDWAELTRLMNEKKLNSEDISKKMSSRDPLIIELRKKLARHFAVGLLNIANILNPQVIVITGGIGIGFFRETRFKSDVEEFLHDFVFRSNLVTIRRSKIKNAQVVGAAMLGYEKELINKSK